MHNFSEEMLKLYQYLKKELCFEI